jgi:Protein of unknown function (DUF2490)
VRTALGIGLAIAMGAACAGPAAAQDTANEVWPEVDVWVQLNPKVKLFFPFSVSKSRETKEREGLIGARVDYRFNRYVSVRAGYGYLWSISPTDPYSEHRPVGEVSLHAFPGASVHLVDRNRVDLRFINGDYSYRYRNRLRLERTFAVDRWARGRTLTPYAMEELGYDSRYDTFNRSRFSLGVETQFTQIVMVDLYVVRQDDSRASVEHLKPSASR